MKLIYSLRLLRLLLIRRFFRSRILKVNYHLKLENLALRQQLVTLKRQSKPPKLDNTFRFFWILIRKFSDNWQDNLYLVKPATVIAWHRNAFKLFWKLKSRAGKVGRPVVPHEIRELIRQMARENPTWGAPRIHGELKKLGFDVSERSVQKYIPWRPADPKKRQGSLTFLRNHSRDIAAMDFFTVPTIGFKILYVFFVIHHERREILHFNVTAHPHQLWTQQQIREAFPWEANAKYMIMDNDRSFSDAVCETISNVGLEVKKTAFRSPWQNGVAERFIGSVRRECLDHVIVLNERHLYRLVKNYVDYYNGSRTHLALGKDAPVSREVQRRPGFDARIISTPQANGFHHRYEWQAVAG